MTKGPYQQSNHGERGDVEPLLSNRSGLALLAAHAAARRPIGPKRSTISDPLLARKVYLSLRFSPPNRGPTSERVQLSSLGRKIGRWYRSLQAIRDGEDREVALAGVTFLKERLLSAPSDSLTAGLIQVIDHCHGGSDGLQQSTFAVIGKLVLLGLSLDEWLQLYLLAMDTDLLPVFVEESLDLLHGESPGAELRETFDLFLYIWKTERMVKAPLEPIEKRKYYRKRIRIPGHFNPVHSDARSEIIIRDICPGGVGFLAVGQDVPRENDLIRVYFLLDGYLHKHIDKLALVRRFDGVHAGAQFFQETVR